MKNSLIACGTCCFFSIEDDPQGICRKHAPRASTVERNYTGAWPLVAIDDFCGEWKPSNSFSDSLEKYFSNHEIKKSIETEEGF